MVQELTWLLSSVPSHFLAKVFCDFAFDLVCLFSRGLGSSASRAGMLYCQRMLCMFACSRTILYSSILLYSVSHARCLLLFDVDNSRNILLITCEAAIYNIKFSKLSVELLVRCNVGKWLRPYCFQAAHASSRLEWNWAPLEEILCSARLPSSRMSLGPRITELSNVTKDPRAPAAPPFGYYPVTVS